MNAQQLLSLSIRALLAWLGLSLIGLWFDKEIVGALLPVLTFGADLISDDYRPMLELVEHEGKDMIKLTATTLAPRQFGPEVTIPSGSQLPAGTNIVHTLVPIVILFTALIAAPVRDLWHRFALVALGIPATLVASVLTTPFVLAGHVEIFFQQLAAEANLRRSEPFLLKWMLFVESGGRWLIPLILALLCIALVQLTMTATIRAFSSDDKTATSA